MKLPLSLLLILTNTLSAAIIKFDCKEVRQLNSLISNKRMLFCLLSFLPALAMMCLIFSFSAQTGEESGSLSSKISHMAVNVGNQVLHLDLSESEIESYAGYLEHPIRKLAHMTEYFILTLLVLFPLFLCGLRGRALILTALIFCVCFAATDEFHQSFVAGRGPSVKDVGIDSIGVCAASLLYWVTTFFHRKHHTFAD